MKSIPPRVIKRWVAKNFDYRERVGKNGPELVIANPFYHNDKKKFNISLTKGTCHDWRGDEWAGPISRTTGKRNCSFINFVARYRGCSFKEAISELFGDLGTAFDDIRYQASVPAEECKERDFAVLPSGATRLAESSDRQAGILKYWLRSRGYSDGDIDRYDLYHIGTTVYWPYYEFGSLVYWQGRDRFVKRFEFPPSVEYDGDGNPISKLKYNRNDFLYGFDDVEPSSRVIIAESIFVQHTIGNGAVATGGAAIGDVQMKKIKFLNPVKGVIFAFDNDKAGKSGILSNYSKLRAFGYDVYYSMPPQIEFSGGIVKDWNELVEHLGMSLADIRRMFVDNMKRLDAAEAVKLRKSISRGSCTFQQTDRYKRQPFSNPNTRR